MIKKYREGTLGALLDEYERASSELKNILKKVDQDNFVKIANPDTKDSNCRSIQTLMNHVIGAGYGYSNYIRKQFGDKWMERKEDYTINSPDAACKQLNVMLKYTLETLENKRDIDHNDLFKNKMKTAWGQDYSLEQLLEHAIVNMLKHRRQIERYLIKLEITSSY